MQKITPFLWFNDNAEQAAQFYCTVFKHAKYSVLARYGDGAPLPSGTAMSVTFELEGQHFMALNGGPHYQLSPAISLFVDCKTQDEVDTLWQKLVEGGQPSRCGWLTDKFGLSWQIIPSVLGEYLHSNDKVRAGRAMQAMLQMSKIDIAGLTRAYQGN